MIHMTYAGGIFVYLVLCLGTITVLWIRELRRCRVNSWERNSRRLLNCPGCHISFTVPENTNVTRCPRCNSICFYRKR